MRSFLSSTTRPSLADIQPPQQTSGDPRYSANVLSLSDAIVLLLLLLLLSLMRGSVAAMESGLPVTVCMSDPLFEPVSSCNMRVYRDVVLFLQSNTVTIKLLSAYLLIF